MDYYATKDGGILVYGLHYNSIREVREDRELTFVEVEQAKHAYYTKIGCAPPYNVLRAYFARNYDADFGYSVNEMQNTTKVSVTNCSKEEQSSILLSLLKLFDDNIYDIIEVGANTLTIEFEEKP
jgi:hypothetical protein